MSEHRVREIVRLGGQFPTEKGCVLCLLAYSLSPFPSFPTRKEKGRKGSGNRGKREGKKEGRETTSSKLLCTEPVSPNRPREQVHHSNAKARKEFISSALGPKSLPAQWNLTRAPNKGVWRLIYRQFFVSVTGVAGVT